MVFCFLFAQELDMALPETFLCPLETVRRASGLVPVGSFLSAQFHQMVQFQINFGLNRCKLRCIYNTLEL